MKHSLNLRILAATALVTLFSYFVHVPVYASTIDLNFMAYDQAAQNTPYYSHFFVVGDPSLPPFGGNIGTQIVSKISLNDAGWGNPYVAIQSQGGLETNSSALRSVGWHHYDFTFDTVTGNSQVLMDGNVIRSSCYTGPLTYFAFEYHNYYSGTNRSTIDELNLNVNGSTVYHNGFDTGSLDSNWTTTRLDAGTFVLPGDSSLTYSGAGALSIGNDGGGNVAATVALDIGALIDCRDSEDHHHHVPDTSNTLGLVGVSLAGLALIRRWPRK